ncbi:glycosyltransferase [Flavobacterium sp.]|uniref:glycosyltransferase n=1 Tax=Flavobacterium sp. TaxID=239 RepID=UPI002610BAC6|nr:glycosyltransferase [Flavobacterium sp.]
MRVGSNPNKQVDQQPSPYKHQVIIPVYIPHEEDYFKDSLQILKICIESLLKTIHNKTFVSIVNNGSCETVTHYLNTLLEDKKIHELIHTHNIGKINAVFKGISGNNIELVTISDADVLFVSGWQAETLKIFSHLPRVGVIGLTPQFRTFNSHCGNIITDNLFSKRLKFIRVKNRDALVHFYDSIGWDRNYNQSYLEYGLGLQDKDLTCFVGSGHFVATYKRDMFEELYTFIGGKKAAGIGEIYIDSKSLEKDYWRVTTHDNFAYHMGNIYEAWMSEAEYMPVDNNNVPEGFIKGRRISSFHFFIKNKLVPKVLLNDKISRLFFRWKKLPKEMIKHYNSLKAVE